MMTQSTLPGRAQTALTLAAVLIAGALAACSGSQEDLSGAAGMPVPMSMGGSVYRDGNGNGRRDADEHPLTGARITLMRDSGNGRCDKDVATTTADDDGKYAFNDLAAGAYCVKASAEGLSPTTFQEDQSASMTLTEGESATLDVGMN